MVRPTGHLLPMEDFKAIKKTRLPQEIVGQIQGFIKEGVLRPGDRLPAERDLAERLGVSRASLREAVRALELQGLVDSRPGAGTFVSSESLDTLISIISGSSPEKSDMIRDVFEVRHILEPQIVGLAAERATPNDVQRMEAAIEQQERQINDGQTGVEGDTAFHFALAQAGQNHALVKVFSTIADILRESRDLTLQTPGRPLRSLASHREILDRIRSGDVEGARAAMEYHIAQVEPAQPSPNGAEEPAPSTAGGRQA